MSPVGLHVLEHYGVVILPALAVAEQIGVPLPAVPALLGGRGPGCRGMLSIIVESHGSCNQDRCRVVTTTWRPGGAACTRIASSGGVHDVR